jgi:hypothetical protein
MSEGRIINSQDALSTAQPSAGDRAGEPAPWPAPPTEWQWTEFASPRTERNALAAISLACGLAPVALGIVLASVPGDLAGLAFLAMLVGGIAAFASGIAGYVKSKETGRGAFMSGVGTTLGLVMVSLFALTMWALSQVTYD